MRIGAIFFLSTLITAFLAASSLLWKDPYPVFLLAMFSWPVWVYTFILISHREARNVDMVQLQVYNNIAEIRRNTDRK
jgi:hypothetical protein